MKAIENKLFDVIVNSEGAKQSFKILGITDEIATAKAISAWHINLKIRAFRSET